MAVAGLIFPGALNLGIGRGNSGLRLRNHGLLQVAGGCQIREGSLLRGHGCNSPLTCGNIVAIIQLHQEISSMHCLIVCNGDAGNETTDFRSNYSDVATDVSVISALREAANSPP